MTESPPLDLVALVPGTDEEQIVHALLSKRRESLQMRPVQYEILKHPRRDSGCAREAVQLLQPYLRRSAHALVMFDHFGSGAEASPADQLAAAVRQDLERSGWKDRAEVIVPSPELEVWVWSDSPHVDVGLGWRDHKPPLRDWLRRNGFWNETESKPADPTKAFEAALRQVHIKHSGSIFRDLAEKVGLERCTDREFLRLCRTLKSWFPPTSGDRREAEAAEDRPS